MKDHKYEAVILFLFLTFSLNVFAQDSSKSNWEYKGIVGLNVSQTSFTNWSQGGENSFVFSFFSNITLNYSKGNFKFQNSLKLTFGKSKLGKEPYKVNDNEFYLQDVLTYGVGFKIEPFFSNILKTILVNGYDYGRLPVKQIAGFFDPAYISQSAGFSYENKIIKSRLGIGAQETITNKFTRYSDDAATPEVEKFKIEAGIETVTEINLSIAQNFSYKGYYRFFGRFKSPGNWDVRMDNTLTAKVNDFVNVNLNVLMIYRKIESPRAQLKEALQLGFSFVLF